MSNVTHGMNVDEVQDLGRFLQDRANRLNRIVQEINRSVYSVHWQGGVAVQFGQQHWPGHRARLQAAANHLHGLGQSALNNASEQRSVSAVRSTSGAPIGGFAPVGPPHGSGVDPGAISAFGTHYPDLAALAAAIGLGNGVKSLADLVRNVKKSVPGPGPLDLLTVPFDVVDVVAAIHTGDIRSAVPGISSIALTGLAAGVPQMVAAGVVTTVAAPAVAVGAVGAGLINLVFQPDHTVNSYVERTYGGAGMMTPTQAAEVTERFAGWSGFGHFVADGVHGFGRTAGGKVSSLFGRFVR